MAGINLEKENEGNTAVDDRKKGVTSKGVTLNINLLGYEVREEIAKSSAGFKLSKPMIISLALIGLALLLNVVSYLLLVEFRDEQTKIKGELEARKAELDNKNKELTDKAAQRDILLQKKNILLWATGNSFKWSSLLEEIRDRTPSNLWVTKIDVTDAFQLNISGDTFDHKTVALFVANLQDSPKFKNVTLDFTKKTTKLKIRDINNGNVPGASMTERTLTSDTKFNIRADVVTEAN